jgi:hypothetical protein
MKRLPTLSLLLLLVVGFFGCNNENQSNSATSIEAAQDEDKSTAVFNCLLNEMEFQADEANATVFLGEEEGQIDSIMISASQAGVTIKSFIYLFDNVGNYPFKNNEAGQGIARGELTQREDGKTKYFFSIDGAAYVSYFNLEKKILSGTFEASYFYKGDEMPETFDAVQGSFNNLPVTIQ